MEEKACLFSLARNVRNLPTKITEKDEGRRVEIIIIIIIIIIIRTLLWLLLLFTTAAVTDATITFHTEYMH